MLSAGEQIRRALFLCVGVMGLWGAQHKGVEGNTSLPDAFKGIDDHFCHDDTCQSCADMAAVQLTHISLSQATQPAICDCVIVHFLQQMHLHSDWISVVKTKGIQKSEYILDHNCWLTAAQGPWKRQHIFF